MKPTETLVQEHNLILKVLDAVEREVNHVNSTGEIRRNRIEAMIDFIRNFADGCHHTKEERGLFVSLEGVGMSSESGPVAVMLHEHRQGREFVRIVVEALPQAESGDNDAIKALSGGLAGYAQLLRSHIMKENEVLFPMAEQMLSREEMQELTDQFDEYGSKEGLALFEKYRSMVENLLKIDQ